MRCLSEPLFISVVYFFYSAASWLCPKKKELLAYIEQRTNLTLSKDIITRISRGEKTRYEPFVKEFLRKHMLELLQTCRDFIGMPEDKEN